MSVCLQRATDPRFFLEMGLIVFACCLSPPCQGVVCVCAGSWGPKDINNRIPQSMSSVVSPSSWPQNKGIT